MGSKKPKMRVTEYFMSLHYGICQGVVEKFVSLSVNDKLVGNCAALTTVYDINRPDLFGGIKKEGGLRGRVVFQNGSDTQLLDATGAAKMGGTPTTLPGYRGIATAFFTEQPGAEAGFFWSANQPFVPPVHFRVTRLDRTWLPTLAAIPGAIDTPSLAICFAIDFSLSMADNNRIDAARAATIKALEALRDSEFADTFDVRVVAWSGSSFALTRRNCQPADYADLITFVNTQTLQSATVFSNAVIGLEDFYSGAGDKCRYFVFLTDGEPNSIEDATAAGLVLQATGADAYAFNLQLTYTGETAKMDNTPFDGVPVITSTADNTLTNSFLGALTQQVDMNPAHIIRECMTNTVWGLGLPVTSLDDASFTAAAETLYSERFGLSMMWMTQSSVEEFVGEVIDHIQAAFYVNPKNGKWTLKLIRDDYDVNTLLVFDRSNCIVDTFKRRTPAEVTNEINVTWTNPINEEEEIVSGQNLGSIVANGGEIVTDNRNYYGVRRADLAAQLVARDLAASTSPLATAEIVTDRTGWDLVPGQVIKFTSEEHGATNLLMRVMKVNYGRPGNSEIKVSLTEDVFSYTKPRVNEPSKTLSEDISEAPQAPSAVEFLTVNRWIASNAVVDGASVTYPETNTMLLVSTSQTSATDYEAIIEQVTPSGAIALESTGTFDFVARTTLTAELVGATTSSGVSYAAGAVGNAPEVDGFAIIGGIGLPEDDHEIALITAIDAVTGTLTLRRGAFDTTPREWAVGTPIRFVSGDMRFIEDTTSSALVAKDYAFRTRTSEGIQAEAAATLRTYTPTERFYAPLRPANVVVQGSGFAPVNLIGYSGDITVTWANRNAVLEDVTVLTWTEGTVTPEAGQTATIKLINDETGTLITQYTGLTGTTYTFPSSARGTADWVRVLTYSSRDGFESIQGHEVLIYFGTLDPASLSAGSWLDVNDIASIWQDANQTTSVTVDGDPIGLIENQKGTIL